MPRLAASLILLTAAACGEAPGPDPAAAPSAAASVGNGTLAVEELPSDGLAVPENATLPSESDAAPG